MTRTGRQSPEENHGRWGRAGERHGGGREGEADGEGEVVRQRDVTSSCAFIHYFFLFLSTYNNE